MPAMELVIVKQRNSSTQHEHEEKELEEIFH
jgi:hypothetical protein